MARNGGTRNIAKYLKTIKSTLFTLNTTAPLSIIPLERFGDALFLDTKVASGRKEKKKKRKKKEL